MPDEVPGFESKILKIASLIGLIIIVITLTINQFNEYPLVFNSLLFFAGCLFLIVNYLNRTGVKKKWLKLLFLIAISLCNNAAWFYNEGVMGSTTFLFVFAVLGTPFIYRKYQIHVLAFISVNAMLLVWIQYRYPDLIIPYADDASQMLDVASVFIFTVIITAITLFLFHRLFQKEKKTIENQNHLLGRQKVELAEKNEMLTELTANKEMITSMIVHDLKNPLSTILGLTNQPEQDENIKKVRHSGKQMLNLVMNILDVQKFENARMPVNRENVLLYDLLNDALTDISPSLDEKKLTIETVGDFNRTVGVDSPLIRRVFINILSNAVKFSPLNEVIRIKAANDPETGKVAVSITDSGQGIVPEKIPHVFEKFAIINPQQEGSNRSTGLGLAFCKMAIEAHNNRIDVISEPDKFTTFRFTLDTFSVIDADTKPVVFESVSSPELVLSDRDIAFLKQHAGNITTLKHYQTGKIISALTGINGETSPGIKTWILEMEKATYTGNEQLFNTLISLIEGDHHEKNTDC